MSIKAVANNDPIANIKSQKVSALKCQTILHSGGKTSGGGGGGEGHFIPYHLGLN